MTSHDLLIFTAGMDGAQLAPLRRSCEMLDVALHVIPAPWTTFVNVKLCAPIEFLSARTERLAMWLDGYDSLLLHRPDEIVRRFLSYRSPVVVSAERNCWPDPEQANRYPEEDQQAEAFVCAGGWIGEREALLGTLKTVLGVATTGDDQRAWTKAYTSGLVPEVKLDRGRDIWHSCADGEVRLPLPCALHFNGRTPGRQAWLDRLEMVQRRTVTR